MKKIFEYAGLSALVLFSFYYTDKVVNLVNDKDPIMVSINEYAENINSKCLEGYITSEGVVLGVAGIIIDQDKSYMNMKGIGFNEELLVYKEDSCIVSSTNNINNYIIRGNEAKNSVSIIVQVNDGTLLESIVSISNSKNIKLSFIVDGSTLERYKDYFQKLYNEGHDVLYGGLDTIDLDKYISIMNQIDKNSKKLCSYKETKDILDMCSKKKINTIRTTHVFNKNIINSVKTMLGKGEFIVLKENANAVEELSALINFIKAKGLDIKTTTEHLDI